MLYTSGTVPEVGGGLDVPEDAERDFNRHLFSRTNIYHHDTDFNTNKPWKILWRVNFNLQSGLFARNLSLIKLV